jgi:hypothetical protein
MSKKIQQKFLWIRVINKKDFHGITRRFSYNGYNRSKHELLGVVVDIRFSKRPFRPE